MVDFFFEIQIIGAKLQKLRIQYGSVGSFYLPHGHYQPSYEGQYLCQAEAACQEGWLYHITIELRPVILWKGRMVNVRVSRVKDES